MKKVDKERKKILMEGYLDKWVVVDNDFSLEQPYVYLKHLFIEENGRLKLKQLIFSGDEQQDGLYNITKYDISHLFDEYTGQKTIELVLYDFDMEIGIRTQRKKERTFENVIHRLVQEKYLTEDEWNQLKNPSFYKGKQKIFLRAGTRSEMRKRGVR